MANIDFFLDFDEIFHGTTPEGSMLFPSSARRVNNFIEQLHGKGHVVTVVPVTSYRRFKTLQELRELFEDNGLVAGLPFVEVGNEPRKEVIAARLAEGKTDAYIILDDYAGAYDADQKNLILVKNRATHNCAERMRGVNMGDIGKARKMIDEQLAAPTRGKRRASDPNNDPSQTP